VLVRSGSDYGRDLSRCRIGWNRSIRGEMNLRAFEVPACGAVLLMERENREVADFFVPGEECVLYGADDFEDVVTGLLAAESRTAIEIVDAEGKRSAIQRSEIEEFTPSPNSLMPVGFEKQIKPEGFADLLAFLKAR
jgi:hypothetical protein